ncbi:MAG TPA: hypothetical protein PLP73_01395 [Candidatus Absconditabacterales bacterium]|nr:hypothetical protein [Candidatus Absconditabacterales bacterium]
MMKNAQNALSHTTLRNMELNGKDRETNVICVDMYFKLKKKKVSNELAYKEHLKGK